MYGIVSIISKLKTKCIPEWLTLNDLSLIELITVAPDFYHSFESSMPLLIKSFLIIFHYFPLFFYVQSDWTRLIPIKPTHIYQYHKIPSIWICSRRLTRPTIVVLNPVPFAFFI